MSPCLPLPELRRPMSAPPEATPSCALVMARTQRPLASKVTLARTWTARLVGLLGRRALGEDEAMVFPRCRAIHTLGMRFPIDAVFVDRDWQVVGLRRALPPWRIVLPVRGAWGVVEVAKGALARIGLRVGDELKLVKKNGYSA